MKFSHALIVISTAFSLNASAQQGTAVSSVVPGKENWSKGMAASVMSWWNDSLARQPKKWSYDMGVVLKGM